MSMIGSTWADDDNFSIDSSGTPLVIKQGVPEKIADAIIKDLCKRKGLRHAWEGIDDDIQKEIRETWAAIVRAGL